MYYHFLLNYKSFLKEEVGAMNHTHSVDGIFNKTKQHSPYPFCLWSSIWTSNTYVLRSHAQDLLYAEPVGDYLYSAITMNFYTEVF